jgi:hypothetical protein
MYTHFWRSSPYPALSVFDAPNGNVTCTRRLRSNTPLQALTLANDTQFVECAQAMAQRVLSEGSADRTKRELLAFQLCLARQPTVDEQKRLARLVDEQLASAGHSTASEPAEGSASRQSTSRELSAWTAVCRVLLNLDEFITRE